MLAHPELFSTGMCNWSVELYCARFITNQEEVYLGNYIKDNRPSRLSSWNAFTNSLEAYYWNIGDIKPRVKWIEKQISKKN